MHGSKQCDTIAGDTVSLSPSVPFNMYWHEKCDRIVIRIDTNQAKPHPLNYSAQMLVITHLKLED